MPTLTALQRKRIQDWLSEVGELYVDVHRPHSGGSGTAYFVRSLDKLETLVAEQTSPELAVTIFRRMQYPLRGIADTAPLAQALQQIPDGQWFLIVSLDHRFPLPCLWRGSGNTHAEFRQELSVLWGQRVGVGQDPFDGDGDPIHLSPDEILVFERERKAERT